MAYITTSDGAEIFYKDWGAKDAQPIVFHHGWPLSSDDWDAQMLFFLANGYRVVASDRRGHGRSSQISTGHDMDHYASDASAVAEHLDLKNAVHIGHSTGGGEVARYVAKFGQPQGRVAKAVLVSAVPPLMVKTDANPDGTPLAVFDGFRAALAGNRAQFFLDVASGPFYGFNRDGAAISEGVIRNWWRQGMVGSALAHYEGIKAFSETDQTEDLKAITVPTLVLQGDDDQIVPYKDAALIQARLLQNATLKIDLPPAEWPRDYDSLDHERDDECRARSTSRKKLSASCVKLRLFWRREPRQQRRAAGSQSASRHTISMDGSPFASGIETFCVDQLQTSIRRQLVVQSAQMGNPHTRTSTAGRPQGPR